jgi:hypothetical protein
MNGYEKSNGISLIHFDKMLVQPVVVVNAITDIDDKCIRQAYEIGYDLDETNENVMNALTQLETDCIYSGMMSQEAKCLVWGYDAGIRATQLLLAVPNSTDLADYLAERDLIVHQCTNLDLLLGLDKPLINVKWSS